VGHHLPRIPFVGGGQEGFEPKNRLRGWAKKAARKGGPRRERAAGRRGMGLSFPLVPITQMDLRALWVQASVE
jgi:hypothetical protein